MKILLDVDGILADFANATISFLGRKHGLLFVPEQITGHDICRALSLPKAIEQSMIAHWRTAGFCTSIEPYEGAKTFVDGLKVFGEVAAVTAPMPGARQWAWEREQWLEYHFGISTYIPTRHKHWVSGDVMIEDSVSNLLTTLAPEKILLRRPWNASEASGLIQAHICQDYFEILQALAQIRNRRAAVELAGGRL